MKNKPGTREYVLIEKKHTVVSPNRTLPGALTFSAWFKFHLDFRASLRKLVAPSFQGL